MNDLLIASWHFVTAAFAFTHSPLAFLAFLPSSLDRAASAARPSRWDSGGCMPLGTAGLDSGNPQTVKIADSQK